MYIFKIKNNGVNEGVILQTFSHCSTLIPSEQKESKLEKVSRTRGFTLIELLVVISIIGLLSSIVLASLVTARDKAKIAAFGEEINQVKLAIELYKTANNGEMPTDSDIVGTYIPRLPKIPFYESRGEFSLDFIEVFGRFVYPDNEYPGYLFIYIDDGVDIPMNNLHPKLSEFLIKTGWNQTGGG